MPLHPILINTGPCNVEPSCHKPQKHPVPTAQYSQEPVGRETQSYQSHGALTKSQFRIV